MIMPYKEDEFGKRGDGRARDTGDTWKEQEVTGEIVDKDTIRKVEAPTVKEIKFAQLINKGMDPMHAVRKVSTVGSNKIVGTRKAEEKHANELLKICQDKMLLDITVMAPKGLKKLEDLLDAKDVMVDKFGDEHTKPDNSTQLGAAKELVKLAMPAGSKGNNLSLVNSVITLVQE